MRMTCPMLPGEKGEPDEVSVVKFWTEHVSLAPVPTASVTVIWTALKPTPLMTNEVMTPPTTVAKPDARTPGCVGSIATIAGST